MIYWFLLILGCQACTKSLITNEANTDSSYVDFLIILRSYVCRILDLYQVLTYVWRKYSFLISTIFCQYWIPTYVGYDNLFQTGILCSKKGVHLLQRRCRRIPQVLLVSTLVQSIPNIRTSNHTLLTNENRQIFPKQNILKFFFN